jgi:hypothetical protein
VRKADARLTLLAKIFHHFLARTVRLLQKASRSSSGDASCLIWRVPVKDRRFGSSGIGIVYALGLAGALAACGGDDSSSGVGGGGGAGGSTLDAGTGGTIRTDAAQDAANDRNDATVDARDAATDAAAREASLETGSDATADARIDVRADVTIDQSADAPADRAADAAPDGISLSNATDAGTSDARDATALVDAIDASTVVDASDAAASLDVIDTGLSANDASDAPTFIPVQFGSWVTTGADGGQAELAADAGPLTWTVNYSDFAQSDTLEGFFNAPLDWTAYRTLVVYARALSGADTEGEVELYLQGGEDSGFVNTTLETNIIEQGDFQALTINVEGQPVLSDVERVGIRITAKDADAGVPLAPTVIQIQSVSIQ